MIRTLTDKEVIEADKEYDKWWSQLHMCSKSMIFEFCHKILRDSSITQADDDYVETKSKKVDLKRWVYLKKEEKLNNG